MRPKARILLLLAVGFSMALPVTLPLARDGGRDYSRCIHSCNVTRQNCDDRCAPACAELFPNSASDRRECEASCHEVCVDQQRDCKARCLALKKNPSPGEP